ncbi:MAG: cupin domain-containing protein [Candidatus Eiseniibacteriota bacterium]
MSAYGMLEAVAETLAYALPEATPPEEIKRRLFSRIGDRGHYFLGAREGRWEPTHVQGLERRVLFVHPETAEARMLVRLAAGTSLADARELGAREVVVARGRVRWGNAVLAEGAFHRAGPTAPAAALLADSDSILLVTVPRLGPESAEPIPPRSRSVSAGSAEWRRVAPGVFEQLLAVDRVRGLRFAIVRMDAGAMVTSLPECGVEERFVLEGNCVCADRELAAGDYHRAGAGVPRRAVTTNGGCRMIAIGEPEVDL